MDEYQEYKGQILGENDNGETEKLKADSITESLKTISTDESAVHNKQGFSISGIFGTVVDSASVNYAFKTPTVESGKIIHYEINDIQSTTNNKVRVDFYEVPIAPASGSDVVAYNHYRVGEVVEIVDDVREKLVKPVYRSMPVSFKIWYDKIRYKA